MLILENSIKLTVQLIDQLVPPISNLIKSMFTPYLITMDYIIKLTIQPVDPFCAPKSRDYTVKDYYDNEFSFFF